MMLDRRTALFVPLAAGLTSGLPFGASLLSAQGSRTSSSLDPCADMRWGRGHEGQRKAATSIMRRCDED
jgi:hypothetical protein